LKRKRETEVYGQRERKREREREREREYDRQAGRQKARETCISLKDYSNIQKRMVIVKYWGLCTSKST
jgi:hypothetical protein